MCWRRLQETETNVAHVVRFARGCSSNHFSAIYFLSLFTCFFLRPPSRSSTTTSQSVGPSIRSLPCCSYSLCVCFHYFSFMSTDLNCCFTLCRCCTLPIKMSSFHRVFFVHHCYRVFFPPLNIYKPRRELFSLHPSVYPSVASRAAKGGEERRCRARVPFFLLPDSRLLFCSLS
jgi:hypothetical protein